MPDSNRTVLYLKATVMASLLGPNKMDEEYLNHFFFIANLLGRQKKKTLEN